MAISTNDAIHKFGTQDTLGTASADVLTTAFSIAADLSTWTNDDDAPMASITLLANFAVAPAANDSLNLFIRPLATVVANDSTVPDANFQHHYAGSFPLNDSTVAQYITIPISLPNTKTSQTYEFYIENTTLQTLPAGWDLYITPIAIGGAA